jgi:hypothetical protein
MKTKNIGIILIVILLSSCVEKRQSYNPPTSTPFKPVLEHLITEFVDSLKEEIKDDELLSIQFFEPSVNDLGFTLRVFLSDWYSSESIDGYIKYGNTTIAIYNMMNDYYELVNKNAITFFTDTLVGFSDGRIGKPSKRDINKMPNFYCIIHSADSIAAVSYNMTFWNLPYATSIRKTRCKDAISFTPSEEYLKRRFYTDSIQAEKDYRYYKKNVEYYRNKKNSPSLR